MSKQGYILIRIKRRWVPEWLWWMAAHFERWLEPLVYFNDITTLLSTDDPEELARAESGE